LVVLISVSTLIFYIVRNVLVCVFYGGTEVTSICFYLSRAHKIIKLCARDN